MTDGSANPNHRATLFVNRLFSYLVATSLYFVFQMADCSQVAKSLAATSVKPTHPIRPRTPPLSRLRAVAGDRRDVVLFINPLCFPSLTILSSRAERRWPQKVSMAASILSLFLRSAGAIDSWIWSSTLTQTGEPNRGECRAKNSPVEVNTRRGFRTENARGSPAGGG